MKGLNEMGDRSGGGQNEAITKDTVLGRKSRMDFK